MSENIPDAGKMGAQAADSVIAQIRQAFDDVGATLEFRVRCLKELAEFKGCKAFSYEGSSSTVSPSISQTFNFAPSMRSTW